jgi:putative hydrolase of the HAD superfamily
MSVAAMFEEIRRDGAGPRPAMLTAIAALRAAGLRTAALTNNFDSEDHHAAERSGDAMAALVPHFDVFVESRRCGLRKPDPAIYEHVCALLDVTPPEAVFLDDLGINLKPARALGMHTIKVVDPDDALRELESVLGLDLRGVNR